MGFKFDWSQVKVEHLTDEDVLKGLAEFEAKYGMDSRTFVVKFRRGELGDSKEFMRWEFYYEAAGRSELSQPHTEVSTEKSGAKQKARPPTQVTTLTYTDVQERLAEMEARYGMDSKTFIVRFRRGELGDSPEFMRWEFYYDAAGRHELASSRVKE